MIPLVGNLEKGAWRLRYRLRKIKAKQRIRNPKTPSTVDRAMTSVRLELPELLVFTSALDVDCELEFEDEALEDEGEVDKGEWLDLDRTIPEVVDEAVDDVEEEAKGIADWRDASRDDISTLDIAGAGVESAVVEEAEVDIELDVEEPCAHAIAARAAAATRS